MRWAVLDPATPIDSRKSLDLLRGMGKSIGGDLDIDDPATPIDSSNPCSHYTTTPLVTNPCTHELASPRRLCPCKRIENTSKTRKVQSRVADE
jgi:hypothetical protein